MKKVPSKCLFKSPGALLYKIEADMAPILKVMGIRWGKSHKKVYGWEMSFYTKKGVFPKIPNKTGFVTNSDGNYFVNGFVFFELIIFYQKIQNIGVIVSRCDK